MDNLLYSWFDVRDRIYANSDRAPTSELVVIRFFSGVMEVGVKNPDSVELTLRWLRELFAPRFADWKIALEQFKEDENRFYEIEFVCEEMPEEPQIERPLIGKPETIWFGRKSRTFRQELPPFPQILALSAFKGGVGRTTMALAIALSFIKRNRSVLLVDLDLEAPSLSLYFKTRHPDPVIAMSDLTVCAHEDTSRDCEVTIDFVAKKLRAQTFQMPGMDGYIYCLPAFRSDLSGEEYRSIEISPKNFARGFNRSPYLLTDILFGVAKKLQVDAVILDLRSGFSEVNASFLLDSRIQQICMLEWSGSSFEGTKQMLRMIAKAAENDSLDRLMLPAFLINKVPSLLRESEYESVIGSKLVDLQDCLISLYSQNRNEKLSGGELWDQLDQGPVTSTVFYDTDIATYVKQDIVRYCELLLRSGLVTKIHSELLMEKIEIYHNHKLLERHEPKSSQPESFMSQAAKLYDFARSHVYGEQHSSAKIMPTRPLIQLVEDSKEKPPVVIVFGQKGAGKTFLFKKLVTAKNWEEFAKEINAKVQTQSCLVLPVLWPRDDQVEDLYKTSVSSVRTQMSIGGSFKDFEILKYLQERISAKLSDHELRNMWLNAIAFTAGVEHDCREPFAELLTRLKNAQIKLLSILDGLESLFDNFSQGQDESSLFAAVRVLLQDVTNYLMQLPNNQIGIIVVIRKDLAQKAVVQNFGQFEARYASYQLVWNWNEAGNLIYWAMAAAGLPVSSVADGPRAYNYNDEQLTELLKPLWGLKMGGDDSREARSMEWTLTNLSDFNGQLQARDIIRFLEQASFSSMSGTNDRILTVQAMKSAVQICGQKKVEEIKAENKLLGEIFDKFTNGSADKKVCPITHQSLQDDFHLNNIEIERLIEAGVLKTQNNLYYFPEIYLLGLRFAYAARGRRRAISLMRLAARDLNKSF